MPPPPTVSVGHDRIDGAYDIRSEDPAFAASFVVDDVATWLLEQNEDAAFETRGPAVLLYRAWIPARIAMCCSMSCAASSMPSRRGSTVDP